MFHTLGKVTAGKSYKTLIFLIQANKSAPDLKMFMDHASKFMLLGDVGKTLIDIEDDVFQIQVCQKI